MKEYWIKNNRVHFEYCNTNFQTVYPYYWKNNLMESIVNKISSKYNIYDYIKNELKIKSFTKKYLIPVSYCGMFAVTKEVILQKKITYYENILNFLLYDKQIGIDNGFLIERLWLSIFNFQKNNKNYKKIESKD